MSFLSLKNQVSTFFESQLDSTRRRFDRDCLIEKHTASKLTEALDSLGSLGSNLEAMEDSIKPCNIGNIVKEAKKELSSPQIAHYLKSVVTTSLPNNQQRYAHLVTCQQCEHLTPTGHCGVKPQYKPMPEAMRDCVSFEAVLGQRVPIANVIYTASELNNLLSRYAKIIFNHLLECKLCHFEAARYCPEAFMTGSSYEALLLVFDDAASKKEALLNAVIKARLSGRSVFESFYKT